jgi:hypothetical protein
MLEARKLGNDNTFTFEAFTPFGKNRKVSLVGGTSVILQNLFGIDTIASSSSRRKGEDSVT